MTKLNQQILQMLRNSEGHLNAEQAFMMAKSQNIEVSMASIYRILNKLAEEGEISKVTMPGYPDIFDKTTVSHGHLYCDICHQIKDLQMPDIRDTLKGYVPFKINSYELMVHTICDKCLKN